MDGTTTSPTAAFSLFVSGRLNIILDTDPIKPDVLWVISTQDKGGKRPNRRLHPTPDFPRRPTPLSSSLLLCLKTASNSGFPDVDFLSVWSRKEPSAGEL